MFLMEVGGHGCGHGGGRGGEDVLDNGQGVERGILLIAYYITYF